MANVVPYINFVDRSQEAIEFYKGVFGGDAEVQSDGDRVVHVDFRAGDIHFMGSDQGDAADSSSGCSLVLNCDSEEQLRNNYTALVDGGSAVYDPVDGGWGSIVAHCIDQFVVTWMLNYDLPES